MYFQFGVIALGKKEQSGKPSSVQEVVDHLTHWIIDGRLKPGDQLPTEFELAEEFNVSRGTIREAVKILVYLGALTIQRGTGTYVASEFSPQLLNPMLYGIVIGAKSASNECLSELREIFEVGTTKLAAQKRSEADLRKLTLIEKKFRQVCMESKDAEQVIEADDAFHAEIMHIANNEILEHLNQVVIKLLHAWRINSAKVYIQDGRIMKAADYHDQILDLITRQDAEAAASLIPETFMWEDSF